MEKSVTSVMIQLVKRQIALSIKYGYKDSSTFNMRFCKVAVHTKHMELGLHLLVNNEVMFLKKSLSP